jgi:hypothetical protein
MALALFAMTASGSIRTSMAMMAGVEPGWLWAGWLAVKGKRERAPRRSVRAERFGDLIRSILLAK